MRPINLDLAEKTILITGAAGFIGSHLAAELLRTVAPVTIVGVDNMNDYYEVDLKEERLAWIDALWARRPEAGWVFIRCDLTDKTMLDALFAQYRPHIVINLAAQAGVRYSIDNPDAYIQSNIIGFYNILESCRRYTVEHLVFASSSSVYGNQMKTPFSVADDVSHPISLYAATKRTDELMAYTYSHLYGIPTTGLRFFTVYGPYGRPDMAYFSFTKKLCAGQTIELYNYGNCKRDFTYVDDIVEGVIRIIQRAPEKQAGENGLPLPPYALYNIGNSRPENMLDFVRILTEELICVGMLPKDYDIDAHITRVPMQPGDVETTYADTSALESDTGFKPNTSLQNGLRKFAEWYSSYYHGASE